MIALTERPWAATHVLGTTRIVVVDGERVDTRGDIHVVPGVHEVHVAMTPCWDGRARRPAPRVISVSVRLELGHRYVIGSIHPTGPGRPTWSQPIVIGDDSARPTQGRVLSLGSITPCDS